MSAQVLREAAAFMRARAADADYVRSRGSAWSIETAWCDNAEMSYSVQSAGGPISHGSCEEEARHIASWHPAVALAVADWLEATSRELDALGDPDLAAHPLDGRRTAALAVARAYLGDDA